MLLFFIIGLVLGIIGLMGLLKKPSSDYDDSFIGKIISGILLIVGLFLIVSSCVIVINPGEVGVAVTLGNLDNNVKYSGINFVLPITDIVIFNAKTQVDTQQANVLTSDALTIATDASINYRIDPASIISIYKTMGTEYKETVVDPTIRSVIRDAFATYDTKTLYSSGRTNLSEEIEKRLSVDLKPRGIIIEDVLLRSAEPPASVKTAIEQKQQMEQEIQKKQFEVQKEQAEANRKIAEANGIAEANRIISNSITPAYIEWYTVDMLKNHHSDAMMYIPTGSNGLPMVTSLPSNKS